MKILNLNKNFYDIESINNVIEIFKDLCKIEIESQSKNNSDNFILKFEYKTEDGADIDLIINEFKNFLVAELNEKGQTKQNDSSKTINELSKDKEENNKCEQREKKVLDEIYNNYQKNIYRYTKVKDKYFLTTDTGKYLFLTNKEFEQFKNNSFESNQDLYDKLEKNHFILTKNNFADNIDFVQKKKGYLFQGPSLHIIILTLRCNLKCSYCHASSKPANQMEFDLSQDDARKTIDVIFQSPTNNISIEFQGGEPTLNFDILKYCVQYANEKNKIANKSLIFSLVTNLVNFNEEQLNFLIKNKVSICSSLDGPKEIHNHNRQLYDNTVKNISNVQNMYKKKNVKDKFNSLTTITKQSLNKPKEIVDEYLRLGMNQVFLKPLNLLGDALKNEDKLGYTAEEYLDFWTKSVDYIIELNKKGQVVKEWKAIILLKKILTDYDPNYCELRSPCGAVTGQLLYNHDGSVYTCDEGRMIGEDIFKLGTVDDKYTDLTTNSTACSMIAASTNDVLYCDKCVYKPFCGVCPVMNYKEFGTVISNIPNSFWCKIHKGQFDYIVEKILDKEIKEIFDSWLEKE